MFYYKFLSLSIIYLISIFILQANLYEGFDFSGDNGLSVGKTGTLSGQTSFGWMSSWQLGLGDAIVSKKDLDFKNLSSSGGSVIVKGERKNASFFGKGFFFRQTDNSYQGTVYGSFRIVPGFMTNETVIGMIFSIPNVSEMSVRNGLFAICPKRWGGDLGMIGAKGRTFKSIEGVPCVKGQQYLVLWSMSQLPEVGNVSDVSLKYWVLNAKQVEYFASKKFDIKILNLAEPGSLEYNVCQFGRKDLKETKRSLYKGIILTPFIYNTTNVHFDEIRISSKSIADAIGLIP